MARMLLLRRLRPLTEPGREPSPSPSFPMPLFTVLPAALSTVFPAPLYCHSYIPYRHSRVSGNPETVL